MQQELEQQLAPFLQAPAGVVQRLMAETDTPQSIALEMRKQTTSDNKKNDKSEEEKEAGDNGDRCTSPAKRRRTDETTEADIDKDAATAMLKKRIRLSSMQVCDSMP